MSLTTVLFVDVEGSTALLQKMGDEAGLQAVLAQLGIVRERLEAYGGHVIKSIGDGQLITFQSPRQAVSFALASQRVLAGSTPRVRFGINTGEVIGADADVHGSPVNAAARIAARADGGEVLVSDVVRQLVGPVPTIRFRDRGRCRLKGFAERWRLWSAEDSTKEDTTPSTIGRTAERAAALELVSSTVAGTGRVLIVEGEAGIGKTHLVRDTTARARAAGLGVLEISADELVRRPGLLPRGLLASSPTGPARSRLDALLNEPPSPSASGEDLTYAVVESSIGLLEQLARANPLLVVVEDLQWADDLSIAVLAAIVQRAAVSRFSVMGSLRPSPRPAALDRLVERLRDGQGSHLRLGSLDDVDVYALASAITGAAPGEGLRARLQSTAGNPLFVTELLRSLDDDGLLRINGGVADVSSGSTPTSLHETLVRRLSWLPSETTDLLRMASLLGGGFMLRDLATVTGRPLLEVAAWLREASLAGLIIGDDDRLAFRHDLIREAVYGHMLPAERRDLHRFAGQALAGAGAPTYQIAQQFALGALPGDVEAAEWLERAARDTMHVSPASAIALLEQAVALLPLPRRAARQAELIQLLAWCGRFTDAEAIANEILAAPPDTAVEFAALLGLCAVYGNRGDAEATIATLHRAAACPGAPPYEPPRQRCLAAQLSMTSGTMTAEDARKIAADTLQRGIDDDDATTQCLAHQVLGVVGAVTGRPTVARDHASRAVTLLESGRVTPASYLVPDVFFTGALLELDLLDDALVAAQAMRRRAEEGGTLATLPTAHFAIGGVHYFAGRWDEAVAELEAGLAVIDDTGSRNFLLYCHAVLAKIALHRSDLATAQRHLQEGVQRFTDRAAVFGVDLLFGVQAEFLWASDQLEAALTVAETMWSQTASIRYFVGYRDRGTLLVRLAVAAGRDELARAVTAELEEGARRSPARSATGTALLCRALVERDPDLALSAVAAYRETPLRPELAACCELTAALSLESGRRQDGVALLREAAAIYADVGAAADTARVDAALRSLGVRRQRQGPSRPTYGWESLTPTEHDISRLVAEGLTNPEIGTHMYISRRTVETHLSHVFTKLGVTGRTQLAAEVTKRQRIP